VHRFDQGRRCARPREDVPRAGAASRRGGGRAPAGGAACAAAAAAAVRLGAERGAEGRFMCARIRWRRC